MTRRWLTAALVMAALGFLAYVARGVTTNNVIGGAINGLIWFVIVAALFYAVEVVRWAMRRLRRRER
jgi:hypothetical protein